MPLYLALLRGINVGGNAKIEMKKLKATFESLDFTNVRTYINTGNVIFESQITDIAKLTKKIETTITQDFGFHVPTLIRTQAQILYLIDRLPTNWHNNTEQKTDILFLWGGYDSPDSLDLIKQSPEVDTLVYHPGAITWHVDRAQYNKSGMHKFVGSVVYKNMTARNINTVRKLANLMS